MLYSLLDKTQPKCRRSVWNANYSLNAFTGIKKESSSQVLLIKCIWLISHLQVCAPLKADALADRAFRCVLTQCQGGKISLTIFSEKRLLYTIAPFTIWTLFPQWKRLFRSGKHSTQFTVDTVILKQCQTMKCLDRKKKKKQTQRPQFTYQM